MSYREENGQVVLTMSREDWCTLLMALGSIMTLERLNPGRTPLPWQMYVEFSNRLNEGNPNYQVEKS